MVTIRYLLSMLIVLLLATSCSQEIFEPSIIRGQVQSESFERIKKEFDKTYKAERLRSLSAKGEFDYSSLQPDWSTAIRDTLSGDIEVVAVPINLEDFCLPVSETLTKEDVERYKGAVSFPRLFHYRRQSDGKEWFDIVILQPTKDYLDEYGADDLLRKATVPSSYEGLLDVYSVEKEARTRRVFRDGEATAMFFAKEGAKPSGMAENLRVVICRTVIVGHHFEQHVELVNREDHIVAVRVNHYEVDCRSNSGGGSDGGGSMDTGGGGGSSSTPQNAYDADKAEREAEKKAREEAEKKLKDDCEELKKKLQENSAFNSKVAELRNYRDNTPQGRTTEMGYVELSDGTFVPLSNVGDHSLTIRNVLTAEQRAKGIKIAGYLHTHTHPTIAPDLSIEGPIQVFSDSDVDLLVNLHNVNQNNPNLKSHSTLVAENYTYILSINSVEHIVSPIDEKERHRLYIELCQGVNFSDLQGRINRYIQRVYPNVSGIQVQRVNTHTGEIKSTTIHTEHKSSGKIKKRVLETDC